MTTKKSIFSDNRFLAGYFTGIAAAATGIGALDAYLGHQKQNFPIKKENTSETKKGTVLCDVVVAPLRDSMLKSCNQANFEHGTVLGEISEKKDKLLEKYSCTPQSWQCKPTKPYDIGNSEYAVEFRYK